MDSAFDALQKHIAKELNNDDDKEFFMELLMAQEEQMLEQEPRRKHGGSSQGQTANLQRNRQASHIRLFNDYFSEQPLYGDHLFRRRYRMRRLVFLRVMDTIVNHDSYFKQKCDAIGLPGLSSIQKCTVALRMLAYGIAADALDEICRLDESSAMETMKRFVCAVRECFETQYLRKPTRADIDKQMAINVARGFPCMFASLDCMHWVWKNCPTAWAGQFSDKDRENSIILEVVADESLWIWHAFWGLPGGNNDINVLDRSPLIVDMLHGPPSDVSFCVNGREYPRYYLLTYGIYPKWSCFVQSIHEPGDEKTKLFAERQETARKDIERCFGVLQARFAIVANPCRQWDMGTIHDIMIACCILHNMVIEDEWDHTSLERLFDSAQHQVQVSRNLTLQQFVEGQEDIESSYWHFKLKSDLVEHL